MKLRAWLQLFRAQTASATICLVMLPYLMNANLFTFESLLLFGYCILVHWISFGHNSLMDTAMGYDQRDPSKKHHPLITGTISLSTAHNVIHWSLCGLAVVAILISLYFSYNPLAAIICIFLWFVFGYSYNSGLDKECTLSFLPISICFTAMGAWGYFLSHHSIGLIGWVLLSYFFFTILFQISWSGHLKELELRERSNILTRMGARVDVTWKGEKLFVPGKAWIYAWFIKGFNVILGGLLCFYNFTLVRLAYWVLLASSTLLYLHKLTKPRVYRRSRELLSMSIMEILTIYTPIPLVLPWLDAIILMIIGVIYFFGMNKLLWKVSYPKV